MLIIYIRVNKKELINVEIINGLDRLFRLDCYGWRNIRIDRYREWDRII